MKNKKGVIRIIEAILAIMILLGVVLVLIQKQPVAADFSTSVYKVQSQILSEISGSSVYRNAVLASDNQKIECYIQSRLQKYSLDFNTSVCNPLSACYCDAPKNIELYSADIIVSSNLTSFQPKRLLMCSWIGTMTQRDCVTCVPTAEVCDNLDNNCNSQIDETFSNKGQACSVGTGPCQKTGIYVCKADKTGTECNVVAGTPGTEICGNGIDEDCNGADLACGPSCSSTCSPSGAKQCSGNAYQTCADYNGDGCTEWGGTTNCPASGTCVGTSGQIYTGSCSGLGICTTNAAPVENCATPGDENCNGVPDEGCPTLTCDGSGYLSKYDFIFTDVNCKPAPVSGTNCGTVFYDTLTTTSIIFNNKFYASYCGEDATCNYVSGCTAIPLIGKSVNTPAINSEKLVCLKRGTTTECRMRIKRIS